MKITHTGKHTHRHKQNPLEKVFSDKWEKENTHEYASGILDWLMGNGKDVGVVTQHDATLAATLIQWLGSPVGQRFLLDVLITTGAKSFCKELNDSIKRKRREND
jgi:hypothetical protein